MSNVAHTDPSPSTAPPSPTGLGRRLLGPLASPITWRRTAHLLLDLPMGTVTFTVVFTGLSVTLGLAVTFLLALPVMWATVALSEGLGAVERSRAAALLGVVVESPHEPLPEGLNWFARLRRRSTSAAVWREFAYHLLLLPVGCLTFTLAVVVWAVPAALCLAPVVIPALPGDAADLWFAHLRSGPQSFAAMGIGIVGLLCAPAFIASLAAMDAALVRHLLGPDPEKQRLQARVGTLETSRSALVEAVDAERRRFERDLHDGAQQRLVSLAMDLGMARSKLDEASGVSPEVRSLVDGAHAEAKRAIVELREVARGVHPAILEDRGLDAALSSLAARCPVPVRLDVHVPERPSRAVEAVAYYLVAEALTNVAKHAQARTATVVVLRRGDRLGVEVTDDGRGGAKVGAGGGGLAGGLAGLADRVASVDGWFQVISPEGGPTTLLAELPCGS